MSALKDKIKNAVFGSLTEYSYENLINIVSCPDEFYKLVKDEKELVKFMNCMNAAYSKLNGVKPEKISVANLPKNVLGSANLHNGSITINKKLVDLFPKARKKNNINFIITLFGTIVHESEHVLQIKALRGSFKNLNRNNDFIVKVIKLDQLLKETVQFSRDLYNNVEANLERHLDRINEYLDPLSKYGNNPMEIFAREAEINFVRTLAQKSNQEEYKIILNEVEKRHIEFINNPKTNNFNIIELLEKAAKSDNKKIIKASEELINFFETKEGSNPVKNILEKNYRNVQESLDIFADSLLYDSEDKDRKRINKIDALRNNIVSEKIYLDCFPTTKEILEKTQSEQCN